jgi:hypothetical protein
VKDTGGKKPRRDGPTLIARRGERTRGAGAGYCSAWPYPRDRLLAVLFLVVERHFRPNLGHQGCPAALLIAETAPRTQEGAAIIAQLGSGDPHTTRLGRY